MLLKKIATKTKRRLKVHKDIFILYHPIGISVGAHRPVENDDSIPKGGLKINNKWSHRLYCVFDPMREKNYIKLLLFRRIKWKN